MKVLYKPFAIVASVIGARIAKSAFQSIWSKIDDQDPPEPTIENADVRKVVAGAALEAATMAAVGAAVDRASARTFHYLTGIWPGKKEQEKKDDSSKD